VQITTVQNESSLLSVFYWRPVTSTRQ